VPLSTSYTIAYAVGAPRLMSAGLRQAPLFYDISFLQIRDGNRHRTGARKSGCARGQLSSAQRIITRLLLAYVLPVMTDHEDCRGLGTQRCNRLGPT
jgi:hypothetical protein